MFVDFIDAWYFLEMHPKFQDKFKQCLFIEVVKVNPITKRAEGDETCTETNIWLECGEWGRWDYGSGEMVESSCHDTRLDCGAKTFEEAIIILSNLVLEYYGDYKRND